jgi:RNA polymerase sigma-70 factor (ECF subfamily)
MFALVLDPVTEDDEAMRRLAAGDSTALAELFDRHRERLFGFLRHIVSDPSLAEDLLSETFLRIYRQRQRFRRGACFVPWMLTIARNLALGELRKQRVRALFLRRAERDPSGETDGWSPEQDTLCRDVHLALRRLPEDQRSAVILREFEELSYLEIGQVLGCTEQAARARVYRARASLRMTLAPLVEDR